ncbi:Inner membrane protein ygbE [Leclercia adecarboxylata]|uniref:Inner membrane protein ygbE n=1 Tax=Leclercia adecarboxylata TaxID=83655 RepID=A0A4U9ILR6_9ENTR|nr:Inner membrane protein ygbE [Leclercia adecarboxylata]
MALGIPFLFYGSNTLFFFLYTWPFFLALMPVAVVVGIALHSLLNGKLLYSSFTTVMTVVAMVGLLFLWLMGISSAIIQTVTNCDTVLACANLQKKMWYICPQWCGISVAPM